MDALTNKIGKVNFFKSLILKKNIELQLCLKIKNLSNLNEKKIKGKIKNGLAREGIEPATSALLARRSNQLS